MSVMTTSESDVYRPIHICRMRTKNRVKVRVFFTLTFESALFMVVVGVCVCMYVCNICT